jgi:iron-sulfur cluster repair protein YtfE (RIC family)
VITEIKLSRSAPQVERDAVDMLVACHQRIRNFTGIAVRLADAHGAGEAEIANAAEAVHRYYAIALPLHEADENDSVYPRLRARLTDSGERTALQSMVDQHGPIDETVARLLPLWDDVRKHPDRLRLHAPELREHAHRLRQLWTEHLALEEEIVFPLIRQRLNADDLRDVHREMKQRRGVAEE